MKTSSPQIYQPLPNTGDAIRLLHLQPGTGTDEIHCNIIHATLDTNDGYEALSYEWGTPQSKKKVVLDGINVDVTPNLWSALSHLRHQDVERILWIDALCINQADTDERNHQVRQMGEIYSRASIVIVWLGCIAPADLLRVRPLFDWIDTYGREEWSPSIYRERYHPQPSNIHLWHQLAWLGSLSYWRRTWIVQEIVLARNLRLCYGSSNGHITATWAGIEFLERGISLNDTSSLPADVEDGPIMKLQHQHKLHRSIPPVHSSLESLLEVTKDSLCRDPRDRVFALLGIVSSSCLVKADYSKNLDGVFIDVLKSVCFNGVTSSSFVRDPEHLWTRDLSPIARYLLDHFKNKIGAPMETIDSMFSLLADSRFRPSRVARIRYVGRPWRSEHDGLPWSIILDRLSLHGCTERMIVDQLVGMAQRHKSWIESQANITEQPASRKWPLPPHPWTLDDLAALGNHVVFVDELGAVGLAPEDTSLEKFICYFEECRAVTVAVGLFHGTPGHHERHGRHITFFRGSCLTPKYSQTCGMICPRLNHPPRDISYRAIHWLSNFTGRHTLIGSDLKIEISIRALLNLVLPDRPR